MVEPVQSIRGEKNVASVVGLRMTRFDNYNIFYYYDMQNDVVYIIRVLYNKVDWQSLFKR